MVGERETRTEEAIKRATIECGGYMNWVWTDEYSTKYIFK